MNDIPVSANGRLPYLDYARVFVMYLVVFGHLLPEYNKIPRDCIYTFHMAFFFLVSGMLHKLNGTVQWRKYLRTLGIPLIFFNLLFFFIINPVFYKFSLYGYSAESYLASLTLGLAKLKKALFYDGNIPSGVTWFLVALLWCKLLMDLVQKNKKVWLASIAVAYIVIIGFHIPFLYIRNALMAFPFYYVGCMCKPLIVRFIHNHYKFYYAVAFLAILALVTYVNGGPSVRHVEWGDIPAYFSFPLFHLGAFSGSMVVLILATCFKNNRLVLFIANSLITIVGLQAIFCDPYRLCCEAGHYEVMVPLAGVILLLCSGIHVLIMRYIPFVLGK